MTDVSRIGAMCLSGIVFAGLATFPGWHEDIDERTGQAIDIKPFPSRPVMQVCLFLSALSSIFGLASALWQHVAAAAASSLASSITQNDLKGCVGSIAAALVWISSALLIIAFIGLLALYRSIRMLDRLTDM